MNARALRIAIAIPLVCGTLSCDRIKSALGRGGDDGGGSADQPSGDLPSLTSFEGEIDISAKGKTSPTATPLNLLVKSEKVRVDVPTETSASEQMKGFTGGGKVYAILDTPGKKLSIVMDAKKQALVIDLNQVGDHIKAIKPPQPPPSPHTPSGPPPEPPKVTKTGQKDKVAGFACEIWEVLNPDKAKTDICVAEKGVSFFHLPLTGIPTEHAWMLELLDGQHFPLRGVAFDKDGKEDGRVELTKIDKRSLDASQFEIPAGYKVIDFQTMMAGMLGPGGPPGGFGGGGFGGPGGPHHPGKK